MWSTTGFDFSFDLHVGIPFTAIYPLSSIRGPAPLLTPVFVFIALLSHQLACLDRRIAEFGLEAAETAPEWAEYGTPFAPRFNQPFPSMPTPAPDFTLVLTFMLLTSPSKKLFRMWNRHEQNRIN